MKDIISANQKLNEWCGTEGINFYEGDTALGFLFEYAVPRAREAIGADELSKRLRGWINDFIEVGVDPVLFLFRVLDNIRQSGQPS